MRVCASFVAIMMNPEGIRLIVEDIRGRLSGKGRKVEAILIRDDSSPLRSSAMDSGTMDSWSVNPQ